MLISQAQDEMRRAYVGGGPGVLISSAVWLAAAAVALGQGARFGFIALYFGAMAIHPLDKLVRSLVFNRPAERPDNPLRRAALESTFAMIAGLLAAWLILPRAPELAFPIAAAVVGARFFLFRTVFGDGVFWLLGASLLGVGVAGALVPALRPATAPLAALVELGFGLVLTARAVRASKIRTLPA
ncbi:DUF7010 family protein [Phenylobacterium deserti]|uniref:Uncharacterized protein n=1 Tax=Phenylobacterium deserti TaxID=1914756 RepID=A0A328AAU1_9CAUL|nr:hypothetical protein [Phenylobacterium deserti]RAK51567.1 hypothetical protein DJ018_16700 [Phenylobacterium deserti]